MSFWSKTPAPLGKELYLRTQQNIQERRTNVENQLSHIRDYVTSHIREWTSTHQLYQYTINIPNMFGHVNQEGEYIYSELGLSFNNGMKNVYPLYPDKDEIVIIGNHLFEYFKTQNLNVEFNEIDFTLTFNWENLQ